MFYVDYVYTFVFKKVWDQFNESISSDIISKMTVKIFNTHIFLIITYILVLSVFNCCHPSLLTFAVFNCKVLVTKDGLKYCL
jgi:hypothetical protein